METTTLFLFFILVWGILGVTFLCIGIGLHVGGRKKYSALSGHCNRSGSAKREGVWMIFLPVEGGVKIVVSGL